MVRIHPDPPNKPEARSETCSPGAIAQLGERLLCKQEVIGSIPIGSTSEAGARNEKREGIAINRAIDRCFFVEAPIGCSLTIWD
jgi:hypothetical protein